MVSASPRQSVMRPPAASTTGTSAAMSNGSRFGPFKQSPTSPRRERSGVAEAAAVEDVPTGARADRLHSRGGAGVEGVGIGDAGDDGRQAVRTSATHRPPVERRPSTGHADAHGLVEEVGDHPDDGTSLVAEGDQGPEIRKAGGELPGPVDRVEDPHPFPIRSFGSELLAHDAVRRLPLLDDSAQRRLHRPIHRRDRGPVGLDLDLGIGRGAARGLARRLRESLGQPDELLGNHAGSVPCAKSTQ